MAEIITTINGWAWGPVMLLLLLGTGLYLSLGLGFASLPLMVAVGGPVLFGLCAVVLVAAGGMVWALLPETAGKETATILTEMGVSTADETTRSTAQLVDSP